MVVLSLTVINTILRTTPDREPKVLRKPLVCQRSINQKPLTIAYLRFVFREKLVTFFAKAWLPIWKPFQPKNGDFREDEETKKPVESMLYRLLYCLAPLNIVLSNQFLTDLRLIYRLEAVLSVTPFFPTEAVRSFYRLK